MKSMGIVDLPFSKARYVGSIEAANNSTILNGNSTVGAVNLTVLDGNSTILNNATVYDDQCWCDIHVRYAIKTAI